MSNILGLLWKLVGTQGLSFLISGLTKLKSLFIPIMISLVIGLAVGGYFGFQFGKNAYIKPEITIAPVKAEVLKSIDDTAKREVKLEEKREQVRTEVKYITKEIIKYVPQPKDESDTSCNLTVGAVGLLNSARTGTDFQPSRYSDAQVQAPTDIGMLELSQSDIELASYCRQLAADHDALVDYIEQYKKELEQYHQGK